MRLCFSIAKSWLARASILAIHSSVRRRLPWFELNPNLRIRRRTAVWVLSIALAGSAAVFLRSRSLVPRSAGTLRQEVYVWQRDWGAAVTESISRHASNFAMVVPLAAEAVWEGGAFKTARIPIDFELLKSAGPEVGLALRIGPYPGPYRSEGEPIDGFVRLATSLIAEAEFQGLTLAELHIDFDCPDSQLAGYRKWIEALKKQTQIPVFVTALPSWLNEAAFVGLAKAADGYILQVHSLSHPKSQSGAFQICDPEQALRWVERAARLRIPFRVALPTYGFQAAFAADGKFLSAVAEGPEPVWPEGTVLRSIQSEPTAMAELSRKWTADRPSVLTGLIWYRLPIQGDTLNWSWPTLAAVLRRRTPLPHWAFGTRRREPGLIEVTLDNDGELDLDLLPAVRVRWSEGRLIAGDGLGGYELMESASGTAQFVPRKEAGRRRVRAGESRVVGWLRLELKEQSTINVETL